MFGSEFHNWWIFPALMIILCLYIMKGGMGTMMCRPGFSNKDIHKDASASALDLLNKRYAQGPRHD
jgi:uncharacterized membrane protein